MTKTPIEGERGQKHAMSKRQREQTGLRVDRDGSPASDFQRGTGKRIKRLSGFLFNASISKSQLSR